MNTGVDLDGRPPVTGTGNVDAQDLAYDNVYALGSSRLHPVTNAAVQWSGSSPSAQQCAEALRGPSMGTRGAEAFSGATLCVLTTENRLVRLVVRRSSYEAVDLAVTVWG